MNLHRSRLSKSTIPGLSFTLPVIAITEIRRALAFGGLRARTQLEGCIYAYHSASLDTRDCCGAYSDPLACRGSLHSAQQGRYRREILVAQGFSDRRTHRRAGRRSGFSGRTSARRSARGILPVAIPDSQRTAGHDFRKQDRLRLRARRQSAAADADAGSHRGLQSLSGCAGVSQNTTVNAAASARFCAKACLPSTSRCSSSSPKTVCSPDRFATRKASTATGRNS